MQVPYRTLAAAGLGVFVISYLFVSIELAHDDAWSDLGFTLGFALVGAAIAVVVLRFDRWWATAPALLYAVLMLLFAVSYISHIKNFDRGWEFVPIILLIAGAGSAIVFAAADLVQRRRRASLVAPAAVTGAYAVALGAIAVAAVASFATMYASPETVSAGERDGATVVRMKNVKFEPRGLTAGAGDPVKLVIENDDLGTHNFVIKDADVKIELGGGEEAILQFTAPAPGEYEYRCTIEGHTKMKGSLVVE